MEKEKVIFVIIAYNVSNLVTLQFSCIKRFCKDPYRIVVVDNSTDKESAEAIKYYTSVAGWEYIKTKASSSQGSQSHAFSANVSYLMLKDFQGVFVYLDQDAFPVREFSPLEILGDKIIAGIGQTKNGKKYLWPGFLVFDNAKVERDLIDFSPSDQHGLDTGGNLFKVLEKYGEESCVFFNEAYEQNPNFTKSFYNFYSMMNDGMVMHFLNSSGWNASESNEERINSLINIVKEKTGL